VSWHDIVESPLRALSVNLFIALLRTVRDSITNSSILQVFKKLR